MVESFRKHSDKIAYLLFALFVFTPLESFRILPYVSVPRLLSIPIIVYGLLLNKKRSINRINVYFAAYVLTTLTFALFGLNKSLAIARSTFTLVPILLLSISLTEITKHISITHFFQILKSWILTTLVLSMVLVTKVLGGVSYKYSADEMRLTVLGQDQNELSYMFVMSISFLFLLKFFRRDYRYFYTSLGLLITAIVLTGSRTGFVSAIMVIFFFAFNVMSKIRLILLIVLATVVFSITMITAGENYYISRVLNVFTDVQEGNLASRDMIWRNGWMAFSQLGLERYLLGIGYKGFPLFYTEHFGVSKNPHNTYISVLIESGIISFIFYMMILFEMLRRIVLSRLKVSLIIVIPFLLFALTLGLESRRWLALTIFVICYLMRYENFNRELWK